MAKSAHTKEQFAKYFEYLDDLRDSGVTNMYGAAPYVQRKFKLDLDASRAVLKAWMSTFSDEPATDRAAAALAATP